MPERDGYETIKMINQGGKCHIVMDYVKGDSLIYWLRYHPDITKQQLFAWIETIVSQMEQYHRSSNSPCYRYLNPYSIIVTKEERLMLIDLEADSNAEILRNMQKRVIRMNFSPQDHVKRNKVKTDLFCTGKTVQFLLAQTDANPKLTRREERQLSKIISRCTDNKVKDSYGEFQTLLQDLPKLKQKGPLLKNGSSVIGNVTAAKALRITILSILTLGVVICAVIQPFSSNRGKNLAVTGNMKEASAKESSSKEDSSREKATQEDAIYMDMGLIQFVKLQEYQKSKEYFSKINDHNKAATYYIQMANYLLGSKTTISDARMMEILEELETMVKSGNFKNWMEQYIAIIRVYASLDSKTASERILKLGEQLSSSVQWGDMDEELTMEVKNYVGASYEATEQNEEAIKSYEELIRDWNNDKEVEGIYISLSMLYKKTEKPDKALECIKQGIARYPGSSELKITYMTLLCGEQSVNRDVCAAEIKKCLDEDGELKKDHRFQTLQKEYNITIDEGGNVWVGK